MATTETSADNTSCAILDCWNTFCEKAYSHPMFWQIAAAVVALVVLLIIIAKLRGCCKGVRLIDTDNGEVRISRSAMYDLVANACRQIDTARRPKIRFYTKRGKVHLRVKVRLYSGRNISVVYDEIKRSLASTLEETLGADRIGAIDLKITGFEREKNVSTPIRGIAKPGNETPAAEANDQASSYNDRDDDDADENNDSGTESSGKS